MERIAICRAAAPRGAVANLRFRLEDGCKVRLYHKTGMSVLLSDLDKFSPDGDLKPSVSIYNRELKAEINKHMTAMHKAYTVMQVKDMDMTSPVLEQQIEKILDPSFGTRESGQETLTERYFRYIEESRRDGVIGPRRYSQCKGKVRKLERFLTIRGLSRLKLQEFDTELLMEFRQFIFEEHTYARNPAYAKLYAGFRAPVKAVSPNTVVSDLKALKAFLGEMENNEEISKSPFKKMTREKRRSLMHVMYDEPFFLRADEFRRVVEAAVPQHMVNTRNTFILNCCLGCRIGDFRKLSMDKVAISPEGIPYIHYIPSKTGVRQATNKEIQTPLVRLAWDIVRTTRFRFNAGNARYLTERYNKELPEFLRFCGIDRKVCI